MKRPSCAAISSPLMARRPKKAILASPHVSQSSNRKGNAMTVTRRELIRTASCGCVALSLLDILRPALTLTQKVEGAVAADQMVVLPAGAVHLSGYLEHYIQLSLRSWSKGVVPYKALAAFFRSGRPKFVFAGQTME